LRQAERTFHLGRIEQARLVGTERQGPDYNVPSSFDISLHAQQRPWEYPGDPPCEVVIRLAPKLVPAIAEIFGRRAGVDHDDRGTIVRLLVSNRAALVAAVLPYGDAAEVISPLELRREIGNIYKTLAQRYAPRKMRSAPAPRAHAL